MNAICNLGENELPHLTSCFIEHTEESQVAFDYRIRCLEQKIRDEGSLNPVYMQKVEELSKNYSSAQLEKAHEDLLWKKISAERLCLAGPFSIEKECRLEEIMVRLIAVKMALEMKGTENELY